MHASLFLVSSFKDSAKGRMPFYFSNLYANNPSLAVYWDNIDFRHSLEDGTWQSKPKMPDPEQFKIYDGIQETLWSFEDVGAIRDIWTRGRKVADGIGERQPKLSDKSFDCYIGGAECLSAMGIPYVVPTIEERLGLSF